MFAKILQKSLSSKEQNMNDVCLLTCVIPGGYRHQVSLSQNHLFALLFINPGHHATHTYASFEIAIISTTAFSKLVLLRS